MIRHLQTQSTTKIGPVRTEACQVRPCFRPGQGSWVYGIPGRFNSGIWYFSVKIRVLSIYFLRKFRNYLVSHIIRFFMISRYIGILGENSGYIGISLPHLAGPLCLHTILPSSQETVNFHSGAFSSGNRCNITVNFNY